MSVKLSRSVVAGKVGHVVLGTALVAMVPLGKVTARLILELGMVMQAGPPWLVAAKKLAPVAE